MNYLKLVNCPIRGLFPVKSGDINSGPVDSAKIGINPVEAMRDSAQGFDALEDGNYVSLIPINDESKLLASGIIDTVGNNDNPEDSASIITEAEADTIRAVLLDVREAQSVSGVG